MCCQEICISYRPQGLSSAISYQDPKAAFKWLEQAFGFEPLMAIVDQDGNLAHSEMKFGSSVVMVGSEWSAAHKSPKSVGGINTQSVHVQLEEDVDAHCARAREAGAVILPAPTMSRHLRALKQSGLIGRHRLAHA